VYAVLGNRVNRRRFLPKIAGMTKKRESLDLLRECGREDGCLINNVGGDMRV
jgi:hypothetical protein